MAALQVINLGLPTSGTTTLGKALKRAGPSVADWRIRAGQDGAHRRLVGDLIYEGDFDSDGERVRWIDGHFNFCRKVFENSDDFLEYDIDDAVAPKQISAFLGLDLPWWGVANANPRENVEETT